MSSVADPLRAYAKLARIFFGPITPNTREDVEEAIRLRFPDVPQISTADLADWIASTQRPRPLLIDVRSEAEYHVSHLPGAIHATALRSLEPLARSSHRPLVLYCAMGYRSSALAAKLHRRGISQAHNLRGSIFAWANEGRPLERDGKPLEPARVHPYNSKWGQLLDPNRRA